MNNWIEISEPHLASNFHVLQAAAGPETEVLAVIKANAYGHGAEVCAVALALAGARWLGVTSAREGARVRQALAAAQVPEEPHVVVMSGFLPEDVPLMRAHLLTPVIWTADHVRWLEVHGSAWAVHVEIDTGMGRQGVRPGAELAELMQTIVHSGIQFAGIFTHFCSSEEAASPLTLEQQKLFVEAVAQVRTAGISVRWIHAGNSSTLDNPAQPEPWLVTLARAAGGRAMVRSGLALYGYALPIGGDASHHVRAALQPVMTWKAAVLAVRTLAAGETVGYNATFTAPSTMQVALIPAGYADGLRRELSSSTAARGGWVMLHGQQASILGRISMNLTVVDVTGIADVRAVDEAILLGAGVTADDHARLAGTIPYEILCGIHPCG